MIADVVFQEVAAQHRTASLPLSHLSIELGHLYAEDFGPGYENFSRHFEQIAPWVERAREVGASRLPKNVKPRISTCFMIDDYSADDIGSPAELVERLRKAAAANDLAIDYLARESGCAESDGMPVADLVVDHLVPDPPRHTTGGRPPVTESGWLCNGQRVPDMVAPAMAAGTPWTPPRENGDNPHSVFVDVELWKDRDGRREWSCAFLASVWQLARLGLLRHNGEAVLRPYLLDEDEPLPVEWHKLPAVIQLNPKAQPFSAYRTMSVLPNRFMPTELAVRTILGQVAAEPEVLGELAARSAHERVELPAQTVQRVGYVFASE